MGTREKPLYTNSIICWTSRLGEYQYMKSCHFYYIQRKTDGATQENLYEETLFFLTFGTYRSPLWLFQRNPLIKPSGKASLFLISLSFVKRRDLGKLQGMKTRVRSWQNCEEYVYLSPLAAIKKHHSLGGSNSRKAFSHSFRSPRAGCHHVASL